MIELVAFAGIGAVAGFAAGLLGIGGGMIIVPALYIFEQGRVPDELLAHVAVATSTATIPFTTASSTFAHWKRQAVERSAFVAMAPTMILGGMASGLAAPHVPKDVLLALMVAFLAAATYKFALGSKRQAAESGVLRPMLARGYGLLVGLISPMVGIGGGTLNVPFLAWSGLPMQRAIGTSSALALPMSAFGAIGFLLARPSSAEAGTVGLIDPVALAVIVLTATLTAPLGVRAVHAVEGGTARRVFAGFLFVELILVGRHLFL